MSIQILPVSVLYLSCYTYRLIYNCTQWKEKLYIKKHIYLSANASFQG